MATKLTSYGIHNNDDNLKGNEIFDLLCHLCKISNGNTDYKSLLKHVSKYAAEYPTSLSKSLPIDEDSVIAKIRHGLQSTKGPKSKQTHTIAGCDKSLNNTELFFKLYGDLKRTQLEAVKRRSIMTFLQLMMNSDSKPNTSGDIGNGNSIYLARQANLMQQRSAHISHERNDTAGPSHVRSADTNDPVTNTRIKTNTTCKYQNGCGNMQREISQNPLAFKMSQKYSGCSLDTASLKEVAELHVINSCLSLMSDSESYDLSHDIVQNVIYAFAGVEGKYLKKDVITGRFKLDTTGRSLNRVLAGMMLRLSELGYYHDLLLSYTDSKSGLSAFGFMGQGFVNALKTEITKYYGLLSILQDQLHRQAKGNAQNAEFVWQKRSEQLTLMKVLVWYGEPLKRMQWLTKIADACQNKKGGALASTIYRFLKNGCPTVRGIAKELLIATCSPLYRMIARWLLEGEITDPHCEYFIECLVDVGPDRLWHDKYRLRLNMLPTFISTDFANKILVAGKSVNFLCVICEDKEPVKGLESLRECIKNNPEHIFALIPDTKLHSTIDAIYMNTSKRVLDVVIGPHKLLQHLQAMRRYLLLGQGDFIGILMENLKNELDRPAKELYSYDLSSIMDAAIRCTNAQYDDPEILNHLDVRISQPCDGDIGWDILSLQYTVRGPLATMLEPSMNVYQIIFKPLWKMKHMEFILSSKIWKDQKCNAKLLRSMSKDLSKLSYRLHLLTSEMMHFVHQMQYYVLFEVIECEWTLFQKRVEQATAMDDILNAHKVFLATIKNGAFLDPNMADICRYMNSVYHDISRLEIWQDRYYSVCFKEHEARIKYAESISSTEASGEFGVTVEKQLERDQEVKVFEQTISVCQKTLENIGNEYESAVSGFLFALNSNDDLKLQLFGVRLDFNDYYKKRDLRLSVPLTFEHMRMSTNYNGSNGNKSMLSSRYSSVAN